ncbi:MAG: phosphoribosylanthranilate isomerase [Planctomycetes bacterium]|nr:phosphoribosylanthranilate isomerase [Planctomycetota bacterium]
MAIRVKICGITNPTDAEEAAQLGVDMVGLNFFGPSPRCIDDSAARAILQALPAGVEPVALFVNEPLARAQHRANVLGIGTVQVHGEQREILPPEMKWIPAFSVREPVDLPEIVRYVELLIAANRTPHAILVDAHVPGLYGGTGQTAPWHLLADFKPGVPLILAGGLTPENVAEAIRIVQPQGVDVASGVESAPGKKDVDKMRRFIHAVRAIG